MKVVAYLACLPPNNKNIEKGEILNRFSNGIKQLGKDEVVLHTGKNIIDADVALSVGWVHENSKGTPHLQLRKSIIDHQLITNKKVLLADSNLFLYKNTENPMHYLRYSFNGVFPNTGIYCDTDINPNRWNSLSKNLGINLKEYRKSGNHILICLQRNGGWSMGNIDVMDWLNQTISTLRLHTDRPIVIRAHPGDKSSKNYLSTKNILRLIKVTKNLRLSKPNASLIDDLKDCWAVVNHNSSPAVGAAIEGIPVFVTDPEKSQAKEIANIDLSQIDNPRLFDRDAWVRRLAMFHWNFKEIESGEAWEHMRKYV
jgi:hypothetical protein